MKKLLAFFVLGGSIAIGLLALGSGSTRGAVGQGAQAAEGGSLGKAIFESKCAQCHGLDGKGNGPAAAFLTPRPRDFTDGKYKFRSTESGSIPTDDDLVRTIQNGLHGTSMPDWKPFLNGDSLAAVVQHVKSFSSRFQNEKPKTVFIGSPVPPSPSSIAAGRNVYAKMQCDNCHGVDGAGTGAVATDLLDDWGNELPATNLTEPWTFRGGATPRDIYLRFRTGLDGSPMPSYKGSATEKEMWNLANYVVSLRRKAAWEMTTIELRDFYSTMEKWNKEHPVEHGKYLVEIFGCGYCHTPIHKDGSIDESMKYAGGQRWRLVPFGDFVSYNLTSDKTTGLGGWTDEQIKTFLTTGVRRDGTRMYPFPMPWASYAGLKDDDLNAIVAYLRTLPPVHNAIPLPKSPDILSYLWGKFKMLVLKEDLPFYVYPGNAGQTAGTAEMKAPSMTANVQHPQTSR